MKTLYITNLGLLENLAQTQVLPYLEGLSKKGIGIEILSFEKKENLKNESRVTGLRQKLKGLGIEWNILPYHRRWGNLWDVFMGLVKTLRIIKKRDIAVLHARSSVPIFIAWPAARLAKKKIIYDRRGTMVGDFVDDVNIENLFSVGFFSRLLDAIDNFLIRHSDATVVLTERMRKALAEDSRISKSGTVIESIPCCADVPRFSNTQAEENRRSDLSDRFVVNYLGSLGTCYLLKEMADFFKAVKEEKKNALFLIISHTDKAYIERVLQKEGLSPSTDYEIIHDVSPEEVPRYFAQVDCSIMFIKSVECKIGSSPTKFGESLAAGIPVIVNKGIGDTEEIIQRERVGVVVENFDADSYERAVSNILSLLEEEGLRDRCIKTAGDFFSLDLGIERYAKVYKRLNEI